MQVRKIDEIIENSHATAAFKRAVQKFIAGKESELIRYSPGSPRIKIIRVLTKILESFPDEAITDVNIEGRSSCSSYYGTLTIGPNALRIRFNWDCQWRAEHEGLRTWYGNPDQTKAAEMFGYQCFEKFERVE
jgi:hypothetical protein